MILYFAFCTILLKTSTRHKTHELCDHITCQIFVYRDGGLTSIKLLCNVLTSEFDEIWMMVKAHLI